MPGYVLPTMLVFSRIAVLTVSIGWGRYVRWSGWQAQSLSRHGWDSWSGIGQPSPAGQTRSTRSRNATAVQGRLPPGDIGQSHLAWVIGQPWIQHWPSMAIREIMHSWVDLAIREQDTGSPGSWAQVGGRCRLIGRGAASGALVKTARPRPGGNHLFPHQGGEHKELSRVFGVRNNLPWRVLGE